MKNQFSLLFSEGPSWVEELLHRKAEKLPRSEALFVSKKLYKEILRVNEEIQTHGLPSHLQLAYVQPHVQKGVFLKRGVKPLKAGSFIGIYTGAYEFVPASLSEGTSYAYDVAQEIHPTRALVLDKGLSSKETYSIQTNALTKGNFTRFINHSSLAPNIEAIISKLPDNRIEILLFAKKTIRPGEQLLSNYGGMYWKVHPFIPDEMTPSTYILTPSGRVKRKGKKAKRSPLDLVPLRHPTPTLGQEPRLGSLVQKVLCDLPNLPKKYEEAKDLFEEIVLERGATREVTFQHGKWRAKRPLAKGQFVGLLGGTLSAQEGIPLAQVGKKSLFLKPNCLGNLFNTLPMEEEGNLSLRLYQEGDDLCPLLVAERPIKPGEPLILRLLF